MAAPASIEQSLGHALSQAVEAFGVSPEEARRLRVVWEAPRLAAHGDLSTSVALQLAKRAGRSPLEVADTLIGYLRERIAALGLSPAVERVEVSPPGFVNLFFSRRTLCDTLAVVLRQRGRFGEVPLGRGARVQVEFVSANPTGPLSVAHGRQAAVGDSLAALLSFCGYDAEREYYLNDEGTQIELLGQSLLARYGEACEAPFAFPEGGYRGEYLAQIARDVMEKEGRRWLDPCPDRNRWFSDFAAGAILEIIRKELEDFGVRFDAWSSQRSLRERGLEEAALEFLKGSGSLYEKEGAWWLKSTAFGDDKDRVVIRSDGRPTYIAADIAYHREKYRRGFEQLINLWGPDHHGYIPRLKAAIQALGHPEESLKIVLVQLCTLRRGEKVIPMSTREGEFVTLRQVMEEVGRDAARFFFLMRKTDSHLDFDLELAKRAAPENPVYYVQYAHARIAGILEFQKRQGSSSSPWDGTLLHEAGEMQLLRMLRGFPIAVEDAVRHLEPHGVARYLLELAAAFHQFYDRHRVVTDKSDLTQARLALVEGVGIVLATGLRLLGVSAPTQM